MEKFIVHPDKTEAFFSNTVQNARCLSAHFHDLTRLWTERWGLRWEDLSKEYDLQGVWKSWRILGINDHLGIFVQGPAYHVLETSPMTRLFRERAWMFGNPFPDSRQRLELYGHYRHLGWLRLTDRLKTNPYQYSASIMTVLRDIESFGAETFPRKIEIAMDISDVDLARDPEIGSVTLAVLSTIPTLLQQNLVRECLDLPRLYADHPATKILGLDTLSIRGQRYLLVRGGFSLQQINQFSVRLDLPPVTILTPHVAAGLLRGTVDHNQE